MAEKVVTILVDDFDGSDAEGTVSFTLRGRTTEIDLSRANTEVLAAVLEPYLQCGRVSKTVPFQSRVKDAEPSVVTPEIPETSRDVYVTANNKTKRAWALAKGYKIKAVGRIPKDVSDAFDAAQRSRMSDRA
jgi:hypothetical protein